MIMFLSAFKYITLKGLWNDYVVIYIKIYNLKGSKKYDRFYGLILILQRFTEMGLLSSLKANNLVK